MSPVMPTLSWGLAPLRNMTVLEVPKANPDADNSPSFRSPPQYLQWYLVQADFAPLVMSKTGYSLGRVNDNKKYLGVEPMAAKSERFMTTVFHPIWKGVIPLGTSVLATKVSTVKEKRMLL